MTMTAVFMAAERRMRQRLSRKTSAGVYAFFLFLTLSGCAELYGLGGDSSGNEAMLSVVSEPPRFLTLSKPESVDPGTRLLRQVLQGIESESSPSSTVGDRFDKAIPLEEFSQVQVHDNAVNALAVSRDGFTVYSGGEDGRVVRTTLLTWNYGEKTARKSGGKRRVESELLLKGDRPILSVSLSPDERYLAVSQFSLVSIYDLGNRRIVAQLSRIKGRITVVSWDPKGELVGFGTAGGNIHVWNLRRGPALGRDTLDDVERYRGEDSPVVALAFHPQGRVFIVAKRDGIIDIWRLIRAEKEMGLFDEYALIDQGKEGSERVRVTQLPSRISTIWLRPDGGRFFVGSSDGNIYEWKLRGIVPGEPLRRGGEAITGLVGLSLQPAHPARGNISGEKKPRIELLAVASRDQRVKFWCERAPVRVSGEQTVPASEQIFVAESELFTSPLSLLSSGSRGSILWAAEKNGSLTVFDSRTLLKSPMWRHRLKPCIAAEIDEPRKR